MQRKHDICGICCNKTFGPLTAPPTTEDTSSANGYVHQIKDAVTCDTTNCIYNWRCKKGRDCPDYPICQYNGKTQREFKKRFSEHRDYVMREVLEQPSGEHFNKTGLSVHDLEGLVIEKVHSRDLLMNNQLTHDERLEIKHNFFCKTLITVDILLQ